MFQHTSYRWTDGSPLVNFEHWKFPDVVNAFSRHGINKEDQWWGVAKSPANEQLNFYMKQLQPHSGTNDTLCVATLIPALATKAWFLVPCDTKFKPRLVCQVDKIENTTFKKDTYILYWPSLYSGKMVHCPCNINEL